jgi:hypothetical protein
MPSKAICVDCHDDEEEAIDREIASLPSLDWKPFSEMKDVRFSHDVHAKKGYGCEMCHGAVGRSKEVSAVFAPTEETCITCHTEEGISDDCRTCHTETRRDRPPPSHTLSWRRTHGITMQEGDVFHHGAPCNRCHGEDSCTECHREMAPEDHNEAWRIRIHGILAQTERERCSTCHTEDACIRCHTSGEVRPISHRSGRWGSPRSRHCLSCHEDPEMANCILCHPGGGAASHAQAPQPTVRPGHVVGADCRSCHLVWIHTDDGGSCERCHVP